MAADVALRCRPRRCLTREALKLGHETLSVEALPYNARNVARDIKAGCVNQRAQLFFAAAFDGTVKAITLDMNIVPGGTQQNGQAVSDGNGNYLVDDPANGKARTTVKVRTVTLDNIVDDRKVVMLKLDVRSFIPTFPRNC